MGSVPIGVALLLTLPLTAVRRAELRAAMYEFRGQSFDEAQKTSARGLLERKRSCWTATASLPWSSR